MTKRFLIRAENIQPLAPGRGSCIASDRITVDGAKVGYMYREEPMSEIESGWVFTAGDESPEYMDDARNFEIYDVNTIANYDASIISFLDVAFGCAFEREKESETFVAVDFEPPTD